MMFHHHALAVREPFEWHGVRLGRGNALTDDDVHELHLPVNAELLRRCTRVSRDVIVQDDDTDDAEAPAAKDAAPPRVAYAPAATTEEK